MINNNNIEQNKFSGHGAGSCPAFPNRTPTTDLDQVAGCPRWSLLIIFDIIDSYFDDTAFPWIIECIHICLLLAGRSHWLWHMSVVTLQMCRHLRTFTSMYLIFIIMGKNLRQTLTSLLPGFVDSLQMVSLPERSRFRSFSPRRIFDYYVCVFTAVLDWW